jgi:AraC family transcriptional regulator
MRKTSDSTKRRSPSELARVKAREIKSILDTSPDLVPTLSELEKIAGLSQGHLQLAFRELYGQTIGRYSKEIKIIIIKELLKNYENTLDTIAIQTGYNGSEALCRFFKMMEGISPGTWRRIWLHANKNK